jgi:hypothetical protein
VNGGGQILCSPFPNQMKLTRRNWAALLAAGPLVAPLIAQVSSAPPTLPATTPDQRSAKAVDDVRKVSDRLAQTEVPMTVEPAFSFRA